MEDDILTVTHKSAQIFLGKIFGLVMLFVFNWLAAHYAGVKNYGDFIYVYTFISLFSTAAVLGLDQALVYYIPMLKNNGRKKELSSLINFCIYATLLLSIILIILIMLNHGFIAGILLNNTAYSTHILLLAPAVLLLSLSTIFTGIFRGFGNISFNLVSDNFIVPITKILAFLFLIFIGAVYFSIQISLYVSLILATMYLMKKYRLLSLKGHITREYSGTYMTALKFGLPVLITGILGFFIQKIDIIMIGYFLTSSDVAVYSIAVQLASISSFILIAFNTIFAPTISSLYHQGNMAKLSEMYRVITKWVAAVNLMAFGIIILSSKDIMHLFGTSFIMGSGALVIIATGQVVNSATGSVGLINTMTGHPEYEIYISIIVIILGSLMNYLLIPLYGINGAALASLSVVTLSNLLRLAFVYRDHKIHPYDFAFLKVVFAFLVSLFIAFFIKKYLNTYWLIELVLLSLFYCICFLGFNILFGLSPQDKEIISKLLKRFTRSST